MLYQLDSWSFNRAKDLGKLQNVSTEGEIHIQGQLNELTIKC